MRTTVLPEFTDEPSLVELNPSAFVCWLKQKLACYVIPNDQPSNLSDCFAEAVPFTVSLEDFVARINEAQDGGHIANKMISPFLIAAGLLIRYFEKTGQRIRQEDLNNLHKLFLTAFAIATILICDTLYRNEF